MSLTTVEVPPQRAAKITELLERIRELSEPGTGGEGMPGSGERLMLMPHDPSCAFVGTMKAPLGKPGPRQRPCDCWQRCVGELLRLVYELQFAEWTLWRQVRMRYLQCEHVTVDAQYRAGHWRLVDTETRRWRNLTSCEQVLAMSGGWTLALADQRHRKSEAWQDARVKLARWNPDVSPGLVKLGVDRIAQTWDADFEPYVPVLKIAA